MTHLIDETILEFGRTLGIADLRLRENGSLLLNVENIGVVTIELIGEYDDHVSLSLTRVIEEPDASACRRILELCHYREPSPWPVHAAFNSRGGLVFAVRMSPGEFNLPNIHQVLDWLDGLHQQIQPAVRLV